jgi:hypothetical protein
MAFSLGRLDETPDTKAKVVPAGSLLASQRPRPFPWVECCGRKQLSHNDFQTKAAERGVMPIGISAAKAPRRMNGRFLFPK